MSDERPEVIVDCDPGHDDALALFVACRHADVVGVTTVAGNVSVEKTTRNALVVLDLIGADAPVHRGAAGPLVGPARDAGGFHGESGMDGPDLPEPRRAVAGEDVTGFVIEATRAEEGLWLVATGPLTNVALALRRDPGLASRLRGVSIMGGSAGAGNVTPVAEFNVWADPEAAAEVFASGARVLMCGLNLTHQLLSGTDEIARLRGHGTRAASFVADLLDFYCSRGGTRPEGPLHDPCAVLAVTHPDLLTFRPRPVAVELTGDLTRGMTVVDERAGSTAPPNVEVAYRIEAAAAMKVVLEAVEAVPDP